MQASHTGRSVWQWAAILTLLSCSAVRAEVTLDGSLGGPSGALSGPHFSIDDGLGKQVGRNLFHSFSSFSIDAGQSATFSSSGNVPIDNVLSRVTGGGLSRIDGALRSTIPNANLYLINPAGVLFGPGASLDVQGSLHISTADYLGFADGRRFSSLPSSSDHALTVAPPSAFGFLGDNPAPITVQRSDLGVQPGETLSIVAGPITISGDVTGHPAFDSFPIETRLSAERGTLNLISIAAAGEARMQGATPDTAGFAQMGEIRIQGGALVDANGSGGGNINLQAGTISIDNSLVRNQTLGTAAGGDITLEARELYMADAALDSSTLGPGRGGNIRIDASGDIRVSGDNRPADEFFGTFIVTNAGILSRALGSSGDAGAAGAVRIKAANLTLLGGAAIDTTTYGGGRGGDIDLQLTDTLLVSGENHSATLSTLGMAKDSSGIVAQAQGFEPGGDAGSVSISAAELSISEGGRLSTDTFGVGAGGAVQIDVHGRARITGMGSVTGTAASILSLKTLGAGDGNAGDLRLRAETIEISDGAAIVSISRGTGEGGDLDLVARGDVLLSGGSGGRPATISANSETRATGAGRTGRISIEANNLLVEDGSRIESATASDADSRGIFIAAAEKIRLSGEATIGPFTVHGGLTTASFGPGDAGDILVHAQRLSVADQARISSTSNASGTTGEIDIQLDDALTIHNASIEASAESSDGGNISIAAQNLVHLSDAAITTSVGDGLGQGGNIWIDPRFVVLDRSQITANAFGGDGGNIQITAANFVTSPDSIIQASSTLQTDGSIIVASPDTDIADEVQALRVPIGDPLPVLDQPCTTRSACM